jgi:hypothetical protein
MESSGKKKPIPLSELLDPSCGQSEDIEELELEDDRACWDEAVMNGGVMIVLVMMGSESCRERGVITSWIFVLLYRTGRGSRDGTKLEVMTCNLNMLGEGAFALRRHEL